MENPSRQLRKPISANRTNTRPRLRYIAALTVELLDLLSHPSLFHIPSQKSTLPAMSEHLHVPRWIRFLKRQFLCHTVSWNCNGNYQERRNKQRQVQETVGAERGIYSSLACQERLPGGRDASFDFVRVNQAAVGCVLHGTGHSRPNTMLGDLRGVGVEGNHELTYTADANSARGRQDESRGGFCLRSCFTRIQGYIRGGGWDRLQSNGPEFKASGWPKDHPQHKLLRILLNI